MRLVLLLSAADLTLGSNLVSSACHSSAVSAACQEYGYPVGGRWQRDGDCCACQEGSRCDGGYQKAVGKTNGDCAPAHGGGSCQAQTTCCIPTVAESQRDYRVSTTTVSSRGAGESSCGADGLARIDSAVEQARAATACGSRMCWIGITDNAIRGRWINADGSLPLYTNWNEQYRQPNRVRHSRREPYAIINAGDVSVYDGSWFDAPDGSFAYALCNVYPPPPSPPSPPPPSGSTVIIAVGAGAGGVVVLLLVLLAIVLSR